MMKYGTPSTERDFDRYEKYSRKSEEHKNALIELGYLEERIFETKYLEAYSPEMNEATEEFRGKYPKCSYSIGGIREDNKIRITCPTEMMPTWEELIEKYDIPPDDPNDG